VLRDYRDSRPSHLLSRRGSPEGLRYKAGSP